MNTQPEKVNTATDIIRAHLVSQYKPVFRRGNAIVCDDGREVFMSEACSVPTSDLIDRLANAGDAPKRIVPSLPIPEVKRDSLPAFFKRWAPVAWGDLLKELPTEDEADIGADSPVRDEFRRLVRDAMLTEVVLGDAIGNSTLAERRVGVTHTERRSVIDWCEKLAKEGPWRSIRSKKCWTRTRADAKGEIKLEVAIRHELFAQLRADRRLIEMNANTFSRRAVRYGVGVTGRDHRVHGQSAVILTEEFLAELQVGTGLADKAQEIWQDQEKPEQDDEPNQKTGRLFSM